MRKALVIGLVALVWTAGPVLAADNAKWLQLAKTDEPAGAIDVGREGSWLAKVEEEKKVAAEAKAAAAPTGDGPPLPLHTIEGVGGAMMVPMAYLVNPGPPGTVIGKPAVSFTYLYVGKKSLQVFAISETLFRRIELSYAFNRFDLGTLPKAIAKAGLKIHRQEVYLHHFNFRALLLEENSFNLPLPAVVAGVHFKVNGGIRGMDNSTDGVLTSLGLDRSNGVDYTLTTSKTIPNVLFGRPIILTAGLRNSQASNIGYTGFGGQCQTTVEADIATLVTDWLAIGYEFRQKNNPYNKAAGILNDEDDWHAIRWAIIVNDHFTIAGGWGYLGPVGNTFANCALGIQLKYEF